MIQATQADVVISGLVKVRNGQRVIDGIDLVIPHGQIVALWGPNGAGKSTLLKILAGIVLADAGEITGPQAHDRSFMPDQLALSLAILVKDWLGLFAHLSGAGTIRMHELLLELGIADLAKRRVSTLSRGMVQRLLFARMLLDDPELLLMDEPENGMDPYWVQEWKHRVGTLKSQGKTVIFSSHLLADALEVADRVLVLAQGRIISDKPAQEWRSAGNPAEAYLALLA